MEKIGIFPGSFNPFTTGHADIVERALKIFDKIIVGVGFNEHKPGGAVAAEKRAEAIADFYADEPRVESESYSGLTVEFACRKSAVAIIRGIRNSQDFEYEKTLSEVNEEIAGMPTVFLCCSPQLSFVSSSMVRELEHNGYDAGKYIATKIK
ncbi:MAG: pantetheine-phosphate adenylyltransferase [Clostridium sp.]|nr:pantetheine-phosphate adenylyltransferase [Prevotella sp.]MCM1429524.1 pantetheine-phosphate adenylyltransferase [Clostridium sp.]MCM1476140.1 pantetheine-phosphate adenylyltransferase [Muribaculaceae bacterium]